MNKLTQVWNGTYFTETPQQPSGNLGFEEALMFNGTTTGMQFPPREWSGASWNADGTKDLVVYDPHLMQVSTYKYLEDTTLGSKDLVLAMYNSSW